MPCYKLGIRFGREDIIKRFFLSGRSGIYFSVLEEGLVSMGDPIERVHEDERRLSIADVNRAYLRTRENIPLVRRIVSLEILPRGLHDDFAEQLALLDQ
jgi:MOSC domain-containing protein YiiM